MAGDGWTRVKSDAVAADGSDATFFAAAGDGPVEYGSREGGRDAAGVGWSDAAFFKAGGGGVT